jgi:hypothetical protein
MSMGEATTRQRHSPWVGINPQVDPVRWARLLRQAHELALSKGVSPSILRALVARSWRRAANAGIDPDRPAPKVLDSNQTAQVLARHPVAHLLPLIESMLAEATKDARYFAALSDADGLLLWAAGHPQALEIADRPAFLPGHLASEGAVGTNAIGTALALDHPVQIFSAEHFNRLLHGWTCSAAPIHDPDTGEIIAVLDLSGEFRSGHPHSLSLVSAVAQVVEGKLSEEHRERESRMRELYLDRIAAWSSQRTALVSKTGQVLAASPRGWAGRRVDPPNGTDLTLADGTEVLCEPLGLGGAQILLPVSGRPRRSLLRAEVLGRRRARVTVGGQRRKLTPKQSEILVLLLLHPDGLSSHELGIELYGPEYRPVTVRAEISRLRRVLGPMLSTRPYRLEADVRTDLAEVETMLERGDAQVTERYRGHLLLDSEVPAIAAARDELVHRVAAFSGGTR